VLLYSVFVHVCTVIIILLWGRLNATRISFLAGPRFKFCALVGWRWSARPDGFLADQRRSRRLTHFAVLQDVSPNSFERATGRLAWRIFSWSRRTDTGLLKLVRHGRALVTSDIFQIEDLQICRSVFLNQSILETSGWDRTKHQAALTYIHVLEIFNTIMQKSISLGASIAQSLHLKRI